MSDPQSSRRDARYPIRPGSSEIEFENPMNKAERSRLELKTLSVGGISFECEREACELQPGITLENASIRIGPCEMRGHVTIRYRRRLDDSRTEFGCLFYPIDAASQTLLMAVVAGIEARGQVLSVRPGSANLHG